MKQIYLVYCFSLFSATTKEPEIDLRNTGVSVRIQKGWEDNEDSMITVKDGENVLTTRKSGELPIVPP